MSRNRSVRRRQKAEDRRQQMVAAVDRQDGFAQMRNGVRRLARERGEWAGIPMPLEGLPLVVEPKFPNGAGLAEIGRENEKPEEPLPDDVKLRNAFWSQVRQRQILIWEEGGKILWNFDPGRHRLDLALTTLGASDAWGIEQESNAMHLLGTLIRHRQFKQYALTGSFMETSARSGVTYMFRRLRPTIALTLREARPRILAALCLHPIAFYEGSWAGGMAPTDDIVAHLMLMRGDEHMFWRRANQHAAWTPEAGL